MGSFGRSMNSTGRRKHDAIESVNLAKAMVPKYTASGLFLKVTAYILRRDRCQPIGDKDERGVPHSDEDVRRGEEKQWDDCIDAGPGDAPGWGQGMTSVQSCYISCEQRSDLLPGLRTNSVERKKSNSRLEVFFLSD